MVSLVALGAAACSDDSNDAVTTTAAPTTEAPTTVAGGDSTEVTFAPPSSFDVTPMGDIVATALTGHVFTELAGLVVDAGLVDTLRGGPFTVFAPTDDAFDKIPVPMLHMVQDFDGNGDGTPDLLATVLTHHVLAGNYAPEDLVAGEYETVAGTTLTITEVDGMKYVDGAPIGAAVQATNGYVYVMNDVLVPAIGDIPTIATTFTCCFETLVALLVQADLVDALTAEGPFTVFAPMDAAFGKLDEATVSAVTSDNELLTTVLTHHVVVGKYNLDQLTDGMELETLAGDTLTVTVDDQGVVSIDGYPVAVGNVQATNGVIHVMGDVLVPEG